MAGKPTGWNRFVAKLQGEVPAAELEAFRRASGPVLELLEQVERRRLECSIDGLDPWTVPPATRAAFLCAWNAFVLQTLGNELLEADYRAEPRTPHFVPPVTAQQVLRFYEPVEAWVNRAWQAQANPDYQLDVQIPAPLPAWEQVEPLPPAHLDGLLHAMRSVRGHAAMAMEFLPATPPAEREKQVQLNRIRQLHASAQSRAGYAEDLCGTDPVPEVRERAAEHAKATLDQLHLLGQLVASPELADDPADENATERETVHGLAAPAPPPGSTQGATSTPALSRVTRYGGVDGQMMIEVVETIDFTAARPMEVHFSLGLAQLRTPESRSVVLRIKAWSHVAYPLLMTGTLTVQTDVQTDVLRPPPGRWRRSSQKGERTTYTEDVDFELRGGLLQRLCSARAARLLFKSDRGSVQFDAAIVARFQAYCRSFYELVVQPVE